MRPYLVARGIEKRSEIDTEKSHPVFFGVRFL